MTSEQGELIVYQTEDGQTSVDVRLEEDTVWLSQRQMVELFRKTKQSISLHIRNVFREGELYPMASGIKRNATISMSSSRSATG